MTLTQRVLGRYGNAIQRLTGGSGLAGTRFQFYRPGQAPNSSTPSGAVGYAENGTVFIDRGYWKNASRLDKRGFLVHELTHLSAGRSKNEETVADAVRLALTGRGPQAGGWTPSSSARQYARQQGWLGMAGTDNNGPRVGNRNRQTVRNLASKTNPGASVPPPVSPGSAANYAAQMAQQRIQLANTLAQLRLQAGQTRGAYDAARGQIKAQRIADTAAYEQNALQRGIVGSSADMVNRASAVTDAAAARVDARQQRNMALSQLRLQGMQARGDYTMGVLQLQQQKAAEQAQLSAQELQQNSFDAIQQNYQAIYQDILKRLLGNGRKRPLVLSPYFTPQTLIDRQGYELGPYPGQAQPY